MVDGDKFPLVDRGRGIRKPAGWDAALSITTAAPRSGRPRPYADEEGLDGLHRYKLRADQLGTAENAGLRIAMVKKLPLIWFYGLVPTVFNAIFPVYLIAEEPEADQFVLALTEDQRQITPGSPVEEVLRRYLISETKRRLHQPVFANQVMLAYDTKCAVCSLAHRELLDAAHITPDSDSLGAAIVTNGLALCKIHHSAYDRNILGIRPDYVVEIAARLLHATDGPMLTHGLQGHHGDQSHAATSQSCGATGTRSIRAALRRVSRCRIDPAGVGRAQLQQAACIHRRARMTALARTYSSSPLRSRPAVELTAMDFAEGAH